MKIDKREEEKKLNRTRLLAYGLTAEEIVESHKKIDNLYPDASLDLEAKDIILQMSIKTITNAVEFACKLASSKEKNKDVVDFSDVKFYMENIVGVSVPGYHSKTDFGGENISNLLPQNHTAKHRKRMNMRR